MKYNEVKLKIKLIWWVLLDPFYILQGHTFYYILNLKKWVYFNN